MSFLRRGSVTFPHRDKAFVVVTRLDGSPQTFRLSDINCWEEHGAEGFGPVCLIYHFLSSTAIRQSFDELTQLVDALRPEVSHGS